MESSTRSSLRPLSASSLDFEAQLSRNPNESPSKMRKDTVSEIPKGDFGANTSQYCDKCGKKISGKFVHALSKYYHLNCFCCNDCGEVVANKFFTKSVIVSTEGISNEEEIPLCELDYFRRLDLICHTCQKPLRGSYITALNYKYHVNHFTCVLCSKTFGPQDNYFEHEGNVYCELHYSMNFAQCCFGCGTPILNQFVEIQRNDSKLFWHPECYMIKKFWNVRLVFYEPMSKSRPEIQGKNSANAVNITEEEQLKQNAKVCRQVTTIWSTLSCFEESSAGCISDILLHVSNGNFAEGIFAAHRLIAHIEITFLSLDKSEGLLIETKRVNEKFEMNGVTGGLPPSNIKHVEEFSSEIFDPKVRIGTRCKESQSDFPQWRREAKSLCRKLIALFDLVRNSKLTDIKKVSFTSNLLSLVTGLAHYLKLLIRISLTTVLRLKQETNSSTCLKRFLKELDTFLKDPVCFETYSEKIQHLNDASSRCVICCKTIESSCFKVKNGTARIHENCFICDCCKKPLLNNSNEACWDKNGQKLLCDTHSTGVHAANFESISRMQQYIFLLHVSMAQIYQIFQDEEVRHVAATCRSDTGLDDYTDISSGPKRLSFAADNSRKLAVTLENLQKSKLASNQPDTNDKKIDSADITSKATEIIQTRNAKPRHGDRNLTLDDIPVILQQQATTAPDNSEKVAKEFEESGSSQKNSFVPSEHQLRPKSALKYFSELSALEMIIVRHLAMISMQPLVKDLFDLDKILNAVEERKEGFWEKFKGKAFKSKDNDKKTNRGKIFGVPLENSQMKDSLQTNFGEGPGSLKIPVFFDDLLSAMRHKDMSIEGVFRKNGNIRKLKDLAELLDKLPASVDLRDENPVQLAALLKMFLRALPEPLLTFKLYKLWITANTLEEPESRFKMLHLTCCLLPKANRDTMEILFVFLSWVASFAHMESEYGSKMDIHNLATVLAPNVLYQKDSACHEAADFKAIEIVQTLITYNQIFATVPSDIATLLQDPSIFSSGPDIPMEEILKKCEALLLQTREKLGSSSDYVPDSAKRRQPSNPNRHAGYHAATSNMS